MRKTLPLLEKKQLEVQPKWVSLDILSTNVDILPQMINMTTFDEPQLPFHKLEPDSQVQSDRLKITV
ncbi:hypothetical protein [Scytonema sp. NUACC26]|uniref:hypothetical protein n=1 Tax=Scytonema sp. NUACC26 TaxID=3140176 RepID=UPI0038B28F1D